MDMNLNTNFNGAAGLAEPETTTPYTDAFTTSFADVVAALRLDFPVPLTALKEGFSDGTSATAVVGTDPNLMNTKTDLSKGGTGFGVVGPSVSTGSGKG